MEGQQPTPGRSRRLLVLVVVIAIIAASVGVIVGAIYLGGASLRVQTTTAFAASGETIPFDSVMTLPLFTNPGSVKWDFGDAKNGTSTTTHMDHAYDYGGTFFVAASSTLSNGRTVDNFGALYPVYVGPRKDLTTKDSLGVIALNTSASSPGAPLIAPGGKIVANGSVQQDPTYFLSVPNDPRTPTRWVNYTWAVASLTFNFGDGSPPQTNATAPPFRVEHTYATAGLYALTLTVTTQNMSTTETVNPSSSVGPVPVSPGQTRSTTVGQTIAVGNYRPVTYSGSIINPNLIVNQEAVTGGFTSLDPAADYESVGFEIIANTYQTLLWYDGAKTDSFVPVISDKLPSVADNTISADHHNYTFHIRPGARFADGTNVTAWDVKYSFTRTMLFVFGTPGTSGWIQSQYLLPSLNAADLTFDNVNNAVTVDNASQTVTFHLNTAVPELLWFQIIADPLGSSIVSSKWLEAHGAGITWTPAGFTDYERFGDLVNYNEYVRTHTMGSGPYKIDYITPGESVALTKNLNFTAVPGIPAPTVSRIFIQYVGEDSTRELSLESGKADIASIASSRYDAALRMQRNGLINVQFFPTLNLFWWNLNLEIAGTPSSDNDVPSNFFTDLNMRKAFAYSYNYDNYLDNIVGNKKFSATFGEKYGGIIPKGMIGYENLSSYDVFDMNQARQSYAASKFVAANGGVNSAHFHLTIVTETADPVRLAAAKDWAQNLQSLSPTGGLIRIDVRQLSFADVIRNMNPHNNPMAVFYLGWLPDYPYPTDYTYPMLEPGTAGNPYGGTYPAANGFNISYLAGIDAAQGASAQNIKTWIDQSLTSTDINQVIDLSRKAQREFSNLTLYVWDLQQFAYFSYRTWISGIQLEQNPMLGGTDLLYNLLGKVGSVSTASLGAGGYHLDAALFQGFQVSLTALAVLALRMRLRAG